MELQDASLLLTGGTGSFGRAFAAHALRAGARRVAILSRDEWKQADMAATPPYDDARCRYFLGDVRDLDRLCMAFAGIDVVVHAAALKRVDKGEYDPAEFAKTNVLGTANVIEACRRSGVRQLVALSSDKACQPLNAYGATKACLERMVVAANAYGGADGMRTAVVRYGNVAGSRGSVVPYYRSLNGSATLPVTDPRMTRYWMRMEQAVDLVAHAIAHMAGGELYVPRLPSFRIVDLVAAMGRQPAIIGLRPGEKLYEKMVSEDEAHEFRCDRDLFVRGGAGGTALPGGWSYRSDTNERFLSVDELRAELASVA